jgi:hypothetical protein
MENKEEIAQGSLSLPLSAAELFWSHLVSVDSWLRHQSFIVQFLCFSGVCFVVCCINVIISVRRPKALERERLRLIEKEELRRVRRELRDEEGLEDDEGEEIDIGNMLNAVPFATLILVILLVLLSVMCS